jgi:hypothetical protein
MDAVLSGFAEIIRGGVTGFGYAFVCVAGQEVCRSRQQVRTTSLIWAFCIALFLAGTATAVPEGMPVDGALFTFGASFIAFMMGSEIERVNARRDNRMPGEARPQTVEKNHVDLPPPH